MTDRVLYTIQWTLVAVFTACIIADQYIDRVVLVITLAVCGIGIVTIGVWRRWERPS